MPEASQRLTVLSVLLESPGEGGAAGQCPPAYTSSACLGEGGTDCPQHWVDEGAGAWAAKPGVTSRCQHSIEPLEETNLLKVLCSC